MKTAFITGANKGIGFETARQLLAKGYYVFIGCRDVLKGEEALKQLHNQGFTHFELIE
ncbi:SDR family NAD(P)-dependent oxidoreductase [Rubrolithibacter danxiaensis]|uniref:SDR family NAD(P)-dependent oxidoreductase n=1 Tax=Rubrolithibacter danxiaensis TaxID=3390805 RepID=UPI003BF836F9